MKLKNTKTNQIRQIAIRKPIRERIDASSALIRASI